MQRFLRTCLATSAAVFSFYAASFGQTAPSNDFPNITIKNFGQMDTNYYRGAQPKKEDYAALKALGVTTVIDLQRYPKDYEKPAVEALGMKYINIGMTSGAYPKPEEVAEFLKIMNDPATGVVYVHCLGGKHRTGIMGAAYRFTKDGWDYDKVYAEMKNYNFYSSWGHGDMKDFVIDYAAKFKQANTTTSTAAAASTSNRK